MKKTNASPVASIESLKHDMHYTKLIIKGFEKRIKRNLSEIESFKEEIYNYSKQLAECRNLIKTLKENGKTQS